jgi:sugar/nucleoside kinase (ribokinase family)
MTRSGIVLAGTVILDIVNVIDHWPQEERLASILRTEYGAGGPPHNAAAALIKLGASFPVTCIGAVGDDSYGEIFLRQASDYGLNISTIKAVAGAITSHTHVMSSAATGRRTFFYQSGVNDRLEPSELFPVNLKAKIFYAGSPGVARSMDDNGGWVKLLSTAKSKGFETALELVPMPHEILRELVPPCLPHIDILVINDHVASGITGIEVAPDAQLDTEKCVAACRILLEMGVSKVAVIHHPAGAVAMLKNGTVEKRGSVKINESEIVGSVGAGDAFYAGFLYGWHENWQLGQCLELGNAAAATSLFSVTTSASIRTVEESLRFAKERGLNRLQ